MTKKELELLFDALTLYYQNESESDALDLKEKSELIHRISKLRLKIYQKLK